MKLLQVTANNFKNCTNNFMINLVAKANKTEADKLYELQEIAPNLYTFNTNAFVGKNASGKSTAIELLEFCYRILGTFHLESVNYKLINVELSMTFFHNNYIYKYTAVLNSDIFIPGKVLFSNEHIYEKEYFPSKGKRILDEDFKEKIFNNELPKDTSKIFFILKEQQTTSIYFDDRDDIPSSYDLFFDQMNSFSNFQKVFGSILKIFDENISDLFRTKDGNYQLTYKGEITTKTARELYWFLSSGTTKGMILYSFIAMSLSEGIDIIIDEIENHFHKTLVENVISLYKDPSINTKHASLIFTTHYCELLDLFGRKDNIWITKSNGQIYVENMYEQYKDFPNNIKSKQFYNNAFDTAVNYKELMNLKKALKKRYH